ncbi:MAG: cytochrome d ubiquinol oxidase subunit II [Polyangiaceae bacterium]|jgi:cytochrome d ubiquinol oxidase subunit II
MEALWFAILAAMLTAWVVLDGFDFGAGIVQGIVAKTPKERAVILGAIGPVWDGNEVWLVAAGGVFVFAFPHAYAVAMSGMYLPLVMVLWLLVLRGVSIELRGQVPNPLWQEGWDRVFSISSTAMALVTGVALGNVVRGVPIDDSGWFELDLFSLRADRAGALDAYTALLGGFAVVVLAAHGAVYLAWKTEGELRSRCVVTAQWTWLAVVVLFVAATAATALARPDMVRTFVARPWLWPLPWIAAAMPQTVRMAIARARDGLAFVASGTFIAALLIATAGVLYPTLLFSTLGRSFDIDARGAASGGRGLELALAWWLPAMALAVAYFINLFRSVQGKVRLGDSHH